MKTYLEFMPVLSIRLSSIFSKPIMVSKTSDLSFQIFMSLIEKQESLQKKYDICLLFGFLYHTSTPVELLQRIRKICRKCLVVDTTLSHKNDASLLIFEEPTEWSRASTQKISLMPSLNSVPKLLEAAGFSRQERFFPAGELKTHNPGGSNIDYFFDYNLLTKLSSFLFRLLNVFGPKFGIITKNKKSRRAIFCAYPS